VITDSERATVQVLDGLANAKVAPHIVWRAGEPDTIDFPAIRDHCFSSGEAILCDVAQDLWSGTGNATVTSILHTLDDRNFQRVIEALTMCRGFTAGLTHR